MKAWPRLFISHCKAIITVNPRAFWDFILFIVSSHLLVSFHFCLIFTEWKSLIQYMFLLVYLICFKKSISSCISFYTTVYYCMYIKEIRDIIM